MGVKFIPIFIVIVCLMYTTVWAESYWNLELNNKRADSTNSSAKSEEYKKYENDMVMGYFMALVPGFVVHGAGNFYAGNGKRGLLLLGLGSVGLIGSFLYAMGNVSASLTSGDVSTAGHIVGAVSLIMFFGSWIWDIATVEKEIRKRHPQNVHIMVGPIPSCNDYSHPVFGLKFSFNF